MLNSKENYSSSDYIELSVNMNDEDEIDEPPDRQKNNDDYENKEEITASLLRNADNNSSEEDLVIYDETSRKPTPEHHSLALQARTPFLRLKKILIPPRL